MKRKIHFDLETASGMLTDSRISIIGQAPKNKPYVSIFISYGNGCQTLFIADKDIRLFIRNLKKAYKAKLPYKQKWSKI